MEHKDWFTQNYTETLASFHTSMIKVGGRIWSLVEMKERSVYEYLEIAARNGIRFTVKNGS